MRINMVVSTNTAAIRVCTACGFKKTGTIPRAFQHPHCGLVDTYVMFHDLDHIQEPPRMLSPTEKPALHFPAAPFGIVLLVDEEVELHPQLGGGNATGGAVYEVEPDLPEGLNLDKNTGAITGSAVGPVDDTRYQVKATVTTELLLRVEEAEVHCEDVSMSINEDFANIVEQVTDLSQLPHEPSKIRAYGDWMIWVVHRVWLDDPTLFELNFNNMHMPAPHVESRIAPKLMAAMEWNTHMEVLSLSNSNVQKVSGVDLATSLRKNRTLKTLNLECNCLDSISVREVALAIKDNASCAIEHLRFSHQKQMGKFYGRPTEEAVGQMMQFNELIVKLGFECDDAHWRNLIDRALLRNNDYFRRRQAQVQSDQEELPTAEEKSLGHVLLLQAPSGPASQAIREYGMLCDYMEVNLKLPTTSQLQNCAKNNGTPIAYNLAAPMIKECRSWMMDGAKGKEVVIADACGTETCGVLREWSLNNDHWLVDLWLEDGGRCTFRSNKDPAFSLSDAWSDWFRSENSLRGSRAGA